MRTRGSNDANPWTSAATERDWDDRGCEQPRHVGGRPGVGRAAAVVQAHDALDDRHVGTRGAVQEQRGDEVLADEDRVEVAAGASGGERVVAGVDVVGADLVRGDGEPAAAQRRHEPGRDGGLAGTGRGGGEDEAGYHSIPRCPF
jgi:hypothetical protein